MNSEGITYDFVAPSRIVFGWGRRREAGSIARGLGTRAFVVCGSRTLEQAGGLDEILESLHEAGVETVRAATISREPLIEDVDQCVAALRAERAGAGDLLLAIGGGSAIDLAKAAAALVTQEPAASVRDYLEGVGTGRKIVNPPLPVLAMPTTAGTGSEATKNAVISSVDPPFKKSLRSDLMVPRAVLIDPELAVSVPPQITAWTGMDAITQLIESHISLRGTPATRTIAVQGLFYALPCPTIWNTGMRKRDLAPLTEAFRDGASREARERMALAALLSGMALANSGLGMAHGVAAALGVHCNVPHGLACAVMLPEAMRTNFEIEEISSEFDFTAMRIVGPGGFRMSGIEDAPQLCIERIEALLSVLKIPRRLSQIGVKREQIPAIVRDSRGNSMSGNPRKLSDDELTQILEDML
ncbi:MAG TPA: iron-containing alcohol dehydrogenase [Planctomycetaceae bacterium]